MGDSKPIVLAPAVQLASKYPVFWPPKKGQKFPDLHLFDLSGNPINISKYAGKVILIEELAMTCPACNAFSGANRNGSGGGFNGVVPQPGLPDFDDYLEQQGVDPKNPNLVVVNLILYGTNMQAPSLAEARAWCQHFKMAEGGNHVVLLGDKSMVGSASYELIPGFQLVDKSFTLCCDSTGDNPKEDLWTVLVPKLRSMIKQ